jgi:hypothetical protein
MRAAVGLSLALALLAPRLPSAQAPPLFTVAVRGGPPQPGSVLEILVRAPSGAHDPQGTAFERPLTFAPGAEPHTWRALVGIDVLQAPGPAPFRIHVASPAERELTSTGTITVAPRVFATRRLRVAGQFVDPSPDQLARITAEAARLDEIFTTVTVSDRVGLFAAPRSYTALVRFSNGRGPDDTKPEVHAMAIKVLVPDGDGPPRVQDFIVADHPVFFARNVQHVFAFLAAQRTPRRGDRVVRITDGEAGLAARTLIAMKARE